MSVFDGDEFRGMACLPMNDGGEEGASIFREHTAFQVEGQFGAREIYLQNVV